MPDDEIGGDWVGFWCALIVGVVLAFAAGVMLGSSSTSSESLHEKIGRQAIERGLLTETVGGDFIWKEPAK